MLALLWTLHSVAVASAAMNCAGSVSTEDCCCAPEPVVVETASCCEAETSVPERRVVARGCDCGISADDPAPVEPPLASKDMSRSPESRLVACRIPLESLNGAGPSTIGSQRAVHGPSPPGATSPRFVRFCSYRC